MCPPPKCDAGLTPIETEVETLDGCPYYKCMNRYTRPTCPTPSCPPGFTIEFFTDSAPMKLIQANAHINSEPISIKRPKRYATEDDLNCPQYECIPIQEEEETDVTVVVDKKCAYSGRTITTFDNLVYKLDLCHHTLIESLKKDWKVECKHP